VGPENQNPLNELQLLDQQVDQITELAGLKPIFFRVDELAKEYPGDFEVQLAASEVKQRVVTRGSVLKQLGQTTQTAIPFMTDPATPSTSGSLPSSTPPPLPAPSAPDVLQSPPALSTTSSAFQSPPVLADQPPPPYGPATAKVSAAPRAGKGWKSALVVGAIAGVLISIAVLAFL